MSEIGSIGALFKLGHLPHGESVRYEHPDTWQRSVTGYGVERLTIAPRGDHLDLILALSKGVADSFSLLYIFAIPNGELELGRYDTPWMTHEEMAAFFADFRDLLERDGRHQLWIGAHWLDGPITMFAYDEHQLIYAYGPLDDFEQVLAARGFSRSDQIEIPKPHSHHYHLELNGEISRMMQSRKWRRTPLLEIDQR